MGLPMPGEKINAKNLKTFTGYIQLKTSSFRLSGYSLQWIKNGK